MVRFRGHAEEREYRELDLAILRRIWVFVRPYRLAFSLCFASLFLSFGLEILRLFLVREAIDGPIARAREDGGLASATLWWLGGLFAGSTVLSVVLGYWFTWTTSFNAQRVIRDVRSRVYRHLLALSPRYFDRTPAGKLVTRVTSDVENLNELIATGVLQTAFDLIRILGVIPILFAIRWQMAVFISCMIPILFGTSLLFRRFSRDAFRRVRGDQARLNGFAAEAVGGITATRIFGQEGLVLGHFAELNARNKESWLRTIYYFALFFAVVESVIYLTQAGLLYFGGTMIVTAGMTAGEFALFWLLLAYVTEPIKQIGEKYNVLQSAFASSERIFQILDEPVRPAYPAHPVPVPLPAGRVSIRCEDLHFGYASDRPVLRGIDFTAAPGQVIAVVGPTGAGKSTLLAMLSRLQDPDRGRVTWNGTDLRELDPVELRQHIAVVPQDVFLFAGSVLDNVRLFDDQVSEARVRDALVTVGAWDLVAARGGLGAVIEERGAGLSQGEKQLLSFARALAADPALLVLDEATASIDTHSEQKIQAALDVLLRDRTCVVVAHRLSTVRNADCILVMRDGQIVERGTHAELLGLEGVYASMLRQAS